MPAHQNLPADADDLTSENGDVQVIVRFYRREKRSAEFLRADA